MGRPQGEPGTGLYSAVRGAIKQAAARELTVHGQPRGVRSAARRGGRAYRRDGRRWNTGLRNLPLHDTAQNQIWLEIVQLALDLLAWLPMLALTGQPRLWEPRRLRLRLFSAAAQDRHQPAADTSGSAVTGPGAT